MPNPTIIDSNVFCTLCNRKLSILADLDTGVWKATCTACKVVYQPSCDTCGQALYNHDDIKHRKQVAYDRGNRICYRCDEEKPKEEFYFKSSTKRWQNLCRNCQASYYKEWYQHSTRLKNRKKNVAES